MDTEVYPMLVFQVLTERSMHVCHRGTWVLFNSQEVTSILKDKSSPHLQCFYEVES